METQIPNGLIAAMNVIDQNAITQFDEIIPKKRMSHNQSKNFTDSVTSANDRVDKDCLIVTNYQMSDISLSMPSKLVYQKFK